MNAPLVLTSQRGVSLSVNRPGKSCLLPDHLHDKLTRSGTRIEIQHNQLLPGSQLQPPAIEGNRNGLPLELPAQMAMPIIFARISRIVLPFRIGRHQPIPESFRIGPDSWFILDNQHGCGGVLDEYRRDSSLDRKSTRLNSSHVSESRMPSSA